MRMGYNNEYHRRPSRTVEQSYCYHGLSIVDSAVRKLHTVQFCATLYASVDTCPVGCTVRQQQRMGQSCTILCHRTYSMTHCDFYNIFPGFTDVDSAMQHSASTI